MATLFSVMAQTLRNLNAAYMAVATGGSTTTVVDTKLPNGGWDADDFVGGTVLVTKTTDSAAPQSESRVITGYTAGGTITVDTAFSAAVGAGDYYEVAPKRHTRGDLVQAINQALVEWGEIPSEDVSQTTAASTREYTYSNAILQNFKQLWIATRTTSEYQYRPVMNYRIEPTTAKVILGYQPPAGYKLKLVYMGVHGFVSADTDTVSDFVPMRWLALAAARCAATRRLQQNGADERMMTALVNDLSQREQAERLRSKRMTVAQFPSLSTWQDNTTYPSGYTPMS